VYLIVRVGISRMARTLDFLAGIRSAGVKLWTKMNAALKATGVAGAEFDEYELEALEAACAAADRAEQLQRVYDAELASDDPRQTTLARLSAEIRHCERRSLQMLERVQLTPEPVKSPRHQRAARTRWDRRDPAKAAAEEQNTPAVRSISGGQAASPPPTTNRVARQRSRLYSSRLNHGRGRLPGPSRRE
jgi:hypothetical protein